MLAIALLRGSIPGATLGFGAGLLVDLVTLGTLGFTSLLLTLAGFWIGRYGETTARGRSAPFIAVGVMTVLQARSALGLHYCSARRSSPATPRHGARAGRSS